MIPQKNWTTTRECIDEIVMKWDKLLKIISMLTKDIIFSYSSSLQVVKIQ